MILARKMTALDRVLLLAAGLLAAYIVVAGVEGMTLLAMVSYTLAFGMLLVSGLLLIILGFEILESSLVVIISTMIPLSLSLGIIAQHWSAYSRVYLVVAVVGFLGVVITRLAAPGVVSTVVLALVHGVAGILIFALPLFLSLSGRAQPGFALVGLGGALIGLVGVSLAFLKTGRPLVSKERILSFFPGLLLITTAAFVAGFLLNQ